MFESYSHCSLHWEECTDNDAASDTSLCAIIHHSFVVQLGQLLRDLHFPPRTPLASWRTSQLGASHWFGALLVCTPWVSVCVWRFTTKKSSHFHLSFAEITGDICTVDVIHINGELFYTIKTWFKIECCIKTITLSDSKSLFLLVSFKLLIKTDIH